MKAVSPALFGITLICFFLPFVNVSCAGQKVAQATGTELAFGTTVQPPGNSRQPPKELKSEPLVLLAFVLCVGGLIIGVMEASSNLKPILSMIASGIVLALLIFFKIGFDQEVLKQGRQSLQVSYQIGFWLSCLLQFATIAVGIAGIASGGKRSTASSIFCDGCGGQCPSGATFCSNCGRAFNKETEAIESGASWPASEEE